MAIKFLQNVDITGSLEADSMTVNGKALDEHIADTVGAMVSGNSESGIAVSYQDSDNTLDFNIQSAGATAGGIKLYSTVLQTTAPNNLTATASRTYAVQLNSGGQAMVNVPWTAEGDLTEADGETKGVMSASDKTKLDAIEASADVTDATNVAAAGASMKASAETISGAKTFSALTTVSNTTDSSSAAGDNGAVRTLGGASIAKKLYVGSTITGSADVIAYSDEKLKENVKTLDGKKVLEMRGVSFDRVDTGKASSGVIAQEMEKVAPELVIDDGNYKGVAYGNLVGYLIEAIKDQQKQINELKYILHGRPE